MTPRPQRLSLSMPKKAIFTLPDAHDVDIECQSGSLWITLDHDRRDIVLEQGQRFRSDSHRRVLVAALEPSCVRFTAERLTVAAERARPERPASPWRLWSHGMSPA
ncbi:DUF2917 domain-containing protein [Variovorax sp. GT1P44]|uniref:DUF2917 domain-containing protein n=1 Tax=Variovorax sp. GT1P44 TaxID=3443742 RepID=UPI003F445EC8